MGCSDSHFYDQKKLHETVTIEHNILALLIIGNTTSCLDLMSQKSDLSLSKPINIHGDNLLHYACKLNNYTICRYILFKDRRASSQKNIIGKLPVDLATDTRIISLFKKT
jgi:hypothetical protein